ncbi:MAG: hypothetical protein QJR03_00830 [Sphaerobacter sp.]|nr:hypothetical protein [Sphaerobacter sp.]
MSGELDLRDTIPLQDLDLLNRLSQYFDALDEHLREGHGWFIFNAAGARGARIVSFIASRLHSYVPLATYYLVPWRDFSLNAYMVGVELESLRPQESQLQGKAKTEFDIATRVSRDAMVRMVAADLLIVSGMRPTHRHEVVFLDETMARRYDQRLSTILLTPHRPESLAAAYEEVVPGTPFWQRLYEWMYERSFIAV